MSASLPGREARDAERRACTNAFAFLRCLTAAGPLAPLSWAALAEAVAADPAGARAVFRHLAGIAETPARLFELRAILLLHLDLRPDDIVLLVGLPAASWQAALPEGCRLVRAAAPPPAAPPMDLARLVAETGASVLAAPPARLAAAAMRQPVRAELRRLRAVIAVGGPLTPAARADARAWLKPDLTLLAWAGRRFWGSPLDPEGTEPTPLPYLFDAP